MLLIDANRVLEADPVGDMPPIGAHAADAPVEKRRAAERSDHAGLVGMVPEIRAVVVIFGAGAEPAAGPFFAVTVDFLVALQEEDALGAPRILHGDVDTHILAPVAFHVQDRVLLAEGAVRILNV